MVKKIVLITSFVLLLASCGKRDGVLDSRQKIDYILSNETLTCDGEPYYSEDWHLSENWNWDGDELYRIDHYDFKQFSENYFYDSHNRISYTTVPAYKIRTDFIYDGKKLQRIECSREETRLYHIDFHHDGKELVGMDLYRENVIEPDTAEEEALKASMSLVFGRDVARMIDVKGGGSKGVVKYAFLWNDGNITRIECPEEGWSSEIEYDDKRNPYSQLYGYSETNNSMYRFEMLSRNNILSLSQNGLDYAFSYEYDKKDFPTQRTVTYSYYAINNTTWDSSLFIYTRTEKYYYNK